MGLYLNYTIQDFNCNILEGNKSSCKLNNICFERKRAICCFKTHSEIKQQKKQEQKKNS